MAETKFAVVDSSGNVVNTMVADQEFVSSLPEMTADADVDTGTLSPDHKYVDVTNQKAPVGFGWKYVNGKFTPPPVLPPTASDVAAAAVLAQRDTDRSRLTELRAKVGPGKPGLSQTERDELNVIIASLELTQP